VPRTPSKLGITSTFNLMQFGARGTPLYDEI